MIKTNAAHDTIFALSSAPGRAGISVFRISGAQALPILKALTLQKPPAPRRAALRRFYHPVSDKAQKNLHDENQNMPIDNLPIDEGLVLFFAAPNSFTGEAAAEFHCHGSPAVLSAMSAAFLALGVRQAEPGEFTRRAFENGRMELTEAEGLADLIDAETQGQRRQALRQMQGGLKEEYESWREALIEALAAIEGEIDFPDEDDVPGALSTRAYLPLDRARKLIAAQLGRAETGERIRSGIDIAIIGPPNAGKSTLLNRLAGREAAIVSETAGTTRDIIDVYFDIGGLPVRFSDTAGLRRTDDPIENEGIRRARQRANSAQVRLAIVETKEDAGPILDELQSGDFLIFNKSDLTGQLAGQLSAGDMIGGDEITRMSISLKTEAGFDKFYSALKSQLLSRFNLFEGAGLTQTRHRACAERALKAVVSAQENLSRGPELAGDDVRRALQSIAELAGQSDIEAVLDAIFSRFCIGK